MSTKFPWSGQTGAADARKLIAGAVVFVCSRFRSRSVQSMTDVCLSLMARLAGLRKVVAFDTQGAPDVAAAQSARVVVVVVLWRWYPNGSCRRVDTQIPEQRRAFLAPENASSTES
jgi:hypothetical protein